MKCLNKESRVFDTLLSLVYEPWQGAGAGGEPTPRPDPPTRPHRPDTPTPPPDTPTPQGRCRDESRMQGDAKGRKGMQADARRCKPMQAIKQGGRGQGQGVSRGGRKKSQKAQKNKH